MSILLLVQLFSRAHTDLETYAKISKGMTFREVCRLIGSGSDDHNQRLPPRTAWEAEVSLKNGRRATAHAWVGEEIALFVYFDDDGRVVAKSGCFLMGIHRESLNDKLRRWLVPREKIRE